jgi:hypothetical protein
LAVAAMIRSGIEGARCWPGAWVPTSHALPEGLGRDITPRSPGHVLAVEGKFVACEWCRTPGSDLSGWSGSVSEEGVQ